MTMLPVELKHTYWYYLRVISAEKDFFKPQKGKNNEY